MTQLKTGEYNAVCTIEMHKRYKITIVIIVVVDIIRHYGIKRSTIRSFVFNPIMYVYEPLTHAAGFGST